MHINMHYTPSTIPTPLAFHNLPLHTTNKHKVNLCGKIVLGTRLLKHNYPLLRQWYMGMRLGATCNYAGFLFQSQMLHDKVQNGNSANSPSSHTGPP